MKCNSSRKPSADFNKWIAYAPNPTLNSALGNGVERVTQKRNVVQVKNPKTEDILEIHPSVEEVLDEHDIKCLDAD